MLQQLPLLPMLALLSGVSKPHMLLLLLLLVVVVLGRGGRGGGLASCWAQVGGSQAWLLQLQEGPQVQARHPHWQGNALATGAGGALFCDHCQVPCAQLQRSELDGN